jgi:hypothetical protein
VATGQPKWSETKQSVSSAIMKDSSRHISAALE